MSSYTNIRPSKYPYCQLPITLNALWCSVRPVETASGYFTMTMTLNMSTSPSINHLSASIVTNSIKSIKAYGNSPRNHAKDHSSHLASSSPSIRRRKKKRRILRIELWNTIIEEYMYECAYCPFKTNSFDEMLWHGWHRRK